MSETQAVEAQKKIKAEIFNDFRHPEASQMELKSI